MAYDSLEERIERLEAVHEIQNVYGRYMFSHLQGPSMLKKPEFFAMKTPGLAVEIDNWGVFRGPDQVEKLYIGGGHGDSTREEPGVMFEHDLTTPVIEVAKDCKTAKGVWLSPGFATTYVDENGKFADKEHGKLRAMWRWIRVACDFVKEDGKWKMWKYHVYGTFFADFYKSWVDFQPPGVGQLKELGAEPTTYHHPYSPDTARELIPSAPEPYETWDEPTDYMP